MPRKGKTQNLDADDFFWRDIAHDGKAELGQGHSARWLKDYSTEGECGGAEDNNWNDKQRPIDLERRKELEAIDAKEMRRKHCLASCRAMVARLKLEEK